MSGVVWFNGEDYIKQVIETYDELKTDSRRNSPEDSPEYEQWALESHNAEVEVIESYLYQFIHPAQLPPVFDRIIKEYDFDEDEVEAMRKELAKYVTD
ncbi:hypothetical protein [Ornithinibacillus scapharcae]|uniref:hypothetical protein n=1 Tax=Ornithinibacillus scapharcae TaxID=1147159 RepID=UPI000225B2E8|nr:hypothetical protein [Ornithinibacillus scapharcae]